MKPIIGISSNLKEQVLSVSTNNIHAISEFGGVPIVLPNIEGESVDAIANMIDGLLLTGGGDIDPTLFGEEPQPALGNITPERDVFEIALIEKMLELNKPILGICRGVQILNIAAGGNMYQDIYTQSENKLLQHDQKAPSTHASHFVWVMKDSLLSDIVKVDTFKVNSFHHQAVRKVPEGFEVSAIASDGTIEAIESKNHAFVIGVQWHPESLLLKKEAMSSTIFQAFLHACKK
ncbi:gamma-glutamyl-gamma-aminobutyrate hydrolase family protein [Psychrobacillus sp.]|uniref:gamma-glutamyl-gamma-aminobutyrate hydrolase family protein n=1 Tax=Psychrobacillus sp. TaxID=1871623 RepID=UPI0028BD243B|nr:gamma-glutamyl-gamma-aminobutyrate hydrolase family protein [Psychrobacillus sp.]